jgi:hypothetical protein
VRPLSGVIAADGSVLCENGLVVRNGVPKGLRRHDPVLVFYNFQRGQVVNILPDVPSEDVDDLDRHVEVQVTQEADGELDDIVETDGLGLS